MPLVYLFDMRSAISNVYIFLNPFGSILPKEKAPSLHLMAVIFLCGIIMVKGLKLEEVSRDGDEGRFFVGFSGVVMPTNSGLMNQSDPIVLESFGLVTVIGLPY